MVFMDIKSFAGGDNAECSVEQRFFDDIKNYKKLKKRLNKLQPSKHIRQLAEPKFHRPKFYAKPVEKFSRHIQIVRDHVPSTRLEQLSLPKVRKLVAHREAMKHCLDKKRLERLNRYIRKSVLSLYSRLANAPPPQVEKDTVRWTKSQWENHQKWLMSRAEPKKQWVPALIKRKRLPLSEFRKLNILAQPKPQFDIPFKRYMISKAALSYEVSERIKNLAMPKLRSLRKEQFVELGKVTPTALKHIASIHTRSLASPRIKPKTDPDKREYPFKVSPNSLKAKPSQRVKELALPKSAAKEKVFNPFKVSPRALKYKPTPRLLELSKPKAEAEVKVGF